MNKHLIAGLTVAIAGVLIVSTTSTIAVGDGDASPRACVDCHKADKKLSAKLAPYMVAATGPTFEIAKAAAPPGLKLKGKHPKVPIGKAIPKNCLGCHAKTSKIAPPLFQMMHLIHETGTNALDCKACHKLAANGTMNIPSADEE